MGYVRRVRFSSFFAGAALASAVGLYFLQKDYMVGHQAISQQMSSLYKSMGERISALEKLKQAEAPKGGEAAE